MTTSTIGRVEGLTVDTDGGPSVYYRNDGDLIVNLKNGLTLTGEYMGILLVKLAIDDDPDFHGVEVECHPSQLGSPADVLDLAIEQLTTVRDALRRIDDASDGDGAVTAG